MALILAAVGAANWRAFDNTRQGLALAAVCAIAAPAFELVIMRWQGLWHYPRPDVFGTLGFPSWWAMEPHVSSLAGLCFAHSLQSFVCSAGSRVATSSTLRPWHGWPAGCGGHPGAERSLYNQFVVRLSTQELCRRSWLCCQQRA